MSNKTYYGEPLKRFTIAMERKLSLPTNVAKPHWLENSSWDIFGDLQKEIVELLRAVTDGDQGEIEKECADVANFAMMLSDKARVTRRRTNVNLHPSITQDKVIAAIKEDDFLGFCIHCGEEANGVEPDARNYMCMSCEEPGVFGAEELLFHVS